jgi:4-hydroxy 2-oxovalerate aldolase
MIRILDCTLRDGGYYTNWDFAEQTVDQYIENINKLPIECIELGYRSINLEGYHGEFFYCPISTLKRIKSKTDKKIAIILNEKDIKPSHVHELLKPCIGLVDLVRIAVDPSRINSAIDLAKCIKQLNFHVAFNVMYLSDWNDYPELYKALPEIAKVVDLFYLVDSYGSVFPEQLRKIIKKIKSTTDIPLGFHGHNNLEMALANTMQAIESGVQIVDATITGMGRGAGNLKTELLVTVLNKQNKLNIDFDALSHVTEIFEDLKNQYHWGTTLPYMVSGINSLPQKNVMSLVQKKIYSLNTIINTLTDKSSNEKPFKPFKVDNKYKTAIIVGGGPSAQVHSKFIKQLAEKEVSTCLIHSSSKNANHYSDSKIDQFFCLLGNEGYRLKNVFNNFLVQFKGKCILPPTQNLKGTFIPDAVVENTFQLNEITFTDVKEDSHLALAIQIALNLGVSTIYFVGYDGYSSNQIAAKDLKFFKENSHIFNDLLKKSVTFSSLTPTLYDVLPKSSVFKHI